MEVFGRLEEGVSALYPYRFVIGPLLVAAGVAALAVAYRAGLHTFAWRHRVIVGVVAIPVLAVTLPAGWYLLSPLWERSHLEEASPLIMTDPPGPVATGPGGDAGSARTMAPAGNADATATPAFQPRVASQGMFEGADSFHFGRGAVLLIETAPDRFILRFEDFSVRNGPDLFVYLSASGDRPDEALNLGPLKATDGAFNYEVPEGTDVSQFSSAIVWCRQFATLFASAPLGEPM